MALTTDTMVLLGVEFLVGVIFVMWREQQCSQRITQLAQDVDKEKSYSRSVSQAVLNLLMYLERSGRHDPIELDQIRSMVINAGNDITLGGDVVGGGKATTRGAE